MFDKIFELLAAVWHSLLPFVVILPYEQGVLMRLGIFKRVLEPGFHWKLPFHIDTTLEDHVTPRTAHIAGLATTTKDGVSIGFDAIVTFRVADIKKAILEVTEVKDAIVDTCAGVIGTELSDATWDDILHGKAVDGLTAICRRRAKPWGIEIMSVQLSGVAKVRSIRLSQGGHSAHPTVPGG